MNIDLSKNVYVDKSASTITLVILFLKRYYFGKYIQ